jgi:hypothetical protein
MVDVAVQSSLIQDAERRAEAREVASIGRGKLCMLVALALLVPALLRPSASGALPFKRDAFVGFDAIQPDYVLIGDSMLGTRIDQSLLNTIVGHNCCYVMWSGGAASAWWHLALKNYALAAEHRPRVVFIFFRDYFLTEPTYRIEDDYWWRIQRLSHPSEPQLMRSLVARETWRDKLEKMFANLYPVQSLRDRARYFLDWMAGRLSGTARVPYGDPVADSFNELFDLDKARTTESDDTGYATEDGMSPDFDGNVETSLLPSMLELARGAGVKLVFVRVQRRPTRNGPPLQSPELVRYIGRLKAYLGSAGAGFYDFTGDPELPLSAYSDGDHIGAEFEDMSTRLFVTRLQQYLQ